MTEKIKKASRYYRNIDYDVITKKNLFGRIYKKLFLNETDNSVILKKLLDNIPDDFSGKLLNIPRGTAVPTVNKLESLKNAEITCVDYSEYVNEQAEKTFAASPNISVVHVNTDCLPMEDDSFDIALSIDWLNSFPDKVKAFKEISRVLKTGGKLISCFYIRGQSKITDWLVKTVLSKKGLFIPPFYTCEELRLILKSLYSDFFIQKYGTIVYFVAIK